MSSTVVVGGGLVGLATAWALAQRGQHVVVLEKEKDWAQHQSSHNSGVVHSGLYYAPGSLKAVMAVKAAQDLERFCAEHGIAFARPGKLVAATHEDELPRLQRLLERGKANGVPVREISPLEAREHEPHVRMIAGLWVSSTGVCDFPALARKLVELLEAKGADLRLGTEVIGLRERGGRAEVLMRTDRELQILRADTVVTCGGLQSDRLTRETDPDSDVRIIPFRGEYKGLRPDREYLVNGLVYPVPDPSLPFLGVHLTRGIEGHVHIGPNAVPAMAREGYSWGRIVPGDVVDSLRFPGSWKMARKHGKYAFGEIGRSLVEPLMLKAVQRLLPEVTADDLVPAEAGVRAQAVRRDGSLCDDFELRRTGAILHVVNAPSPAATASLRIGEHIADELGVARG